MTIRILRLAALDRKLKALPAMSRNAMRGALEKSAAEIVALAKSLVAVDDGILQKSIGWTYGKVPRGAISLGKVAAASLGADLTITVYAGNSEAYYARWVEFGTQKMAAQPYFFPSYRAYRKTARRRISRAINQAGKKAAQM